MRARVCVCVCVRSAGKRNTNKRERHWTFGAKSLSSCTALWARAVLPFVLPMLPAHTALHWLSLGQRENRAVRLRGRDGRVRVAVAVMERRFRLFSSSVAVTNDAQSLAHSRT